MNINECSEAEGMEDMDDGHGVITLDEYIELRNSSPIILSDVTVYDKARQAKVGGTIRCGCGCGQRFIKRTYQHAFARNKGRNNCKDRYYNRTPDRVERTLERYRKS